MWRNTFYYCITFLLDEINVFGQPPRMRNKHSTAPDGPASPTPESKQMDVSNSTTTKR